ncbi:unnamed protein product [Urochloa humidicola]
MDRQSVPTKIGFGVLALNSGLAIYNSWGDAGSVAYVLVAALVMLFLCLREFERARGGDFRGAYGQHSALAKIGFAVFTCNSALAIIHNHPRAGAGCFSLALVLASYAAIVALTWQFLRNLGNNAHGRGLTLLFVRHARFERAGGGGRNIIKAAAAVWGLTTLLMMAMFVSRVTPMMPPAVAALVWAMAVIVKRARGGDGAARNNMAGPCGPYSALARLGLAVLACIAALDTYDGRRDTPSAALVLLCFSVLVILSGLFVAAFARALGGGQGHGY